MNKDGSDLGCIDRRIEQPALAVRALVTTQESLTKAPAPTPSNLFRIRSRKGDKVRSVFHELCIQPKRMTESALDL